jgi:MoxR-like ATPase
MLSYDTLVSQITALPTPVLTATLNRFGGSVGGSKQAAARWLADRIYSGAIAVADVLPATPAAPAPKQDTAAVAAAAAVAGRAESIALDAVAAIKTVKDSVTNVAAMVNTLSDKLAAQTPAVERDEINAAVTRAIADAFAPFKTAVEQAGAQTAVADLSAVHVVRTCPAVDVFGIDVLDMTGAPMIVEVWNHPQAPAVDPDFIWTEPILRHLLLSQQTGENLWFGGDKGTGKSETARQFAARTGRAFTRINFHKFTAAEEYVGAVGLKDGETVFEKKDFLLAYTCPSSVILLDEITNADPGELAPLNGFLEPKACVSFGGQPHVRAPGVLCFAADNTFGSGDDSGRYAGTRNQNSALVDRFARVIAFKFLPADQEIKALSQHTGCSPALARHVHAAIVVARSKVTTAEITDAPSIRSAMAFIRALRVLPPDDAWEAAVVARQPSECHAVLRGIFETCLSRETIAKNL